LMYGAGLRLMECAELRTKDVNFDRGELTIRDGTRLRRICSKRATTSEPSRNYSGIGMSARR
jgi:site-specific recombinase XerC